MLNVFRRDKEIKRLVLKFRTAIEKTLLDGKFDSDIVFSRFPRGCCGDASDLLAQYLLENGIQSTYVCGYRYFDNPEEGTQSHAWLMVNGLIVDITGDQFRDIGSYYNYDQRAYVGAGDAFHRLFEVDQRDVHEFKGIESYGHMSQAKLLDLYGKIKTEIVL